MVEGFLEVQLAALTWHWSEVLEQAFGTIIEHENVVLYK